MTISATSLFLLASASTEISARTPTIDELKDPFNATYGLHLDRVDLRQKALRKTGVANDISTKIVLFRAQKTLMKELIDKKLALAEEISKKEGKKSPRKSTQTKILAAIATLKSDLNAIDLKINGYRKVQKDFGDAIMKTLELTPIQVSKIPPK
jgi:hypothetical protein